MLKLGGYHVCIMDLLVDSRSKKLNGGKIWKHIAFFLMSWMYAFVSYHMALNITALGITWQYIVFTLCYGAVIGGSEIALSVLKYKYSAGEENAKSSVVME